MTCRRRMPSGDEGAYAVVMAAGLGVLIIMLAAFSLDVTNAWAVRRQLSVASDASSLAAGRAVSGLIKPGQSPACDSAWIASAETAALAAATSQNAANDASGKSTVGGATVVCDRDVQNRVTQVRVTVSNKRTLPGRLTGIFGSPGLNPATTATSRLFPTTQASGLRPYAVCQNVANAARTQAALGLYPVFDTYLAKTGSECGSASGNWGVVDFDGGSNPNGDIEQWTQYGYDGAVTIPNANLPGDPGDNQAGAVAAHGDFDAMVDNIVLLPVVTSLTGGGNNAKFNNIAFMAAQICRVHIGPNKDSKVGTCFDQNDWNTQLSSHNGEDFIQFKFSSYITSSYQGSSGCTFGDSTCDFGARGVQLYQ